MIVAAYIDDLLIVSNKLELFILKKRKLSKRFKTIYYCLGMLIIRNREQGMLTIIQSAFLAFIPKRLGMSN